MGKAREDKNRAVGEKRIEREGTREKGDRNRKEQSWATLGGLYVWEARRATGSTRTLREVNQRQEAGDEYKASARQVKSDNEA